MPKTVEAIYALSPQQKGMLFESLHSREQGVHVEQHVFTLAADLNVDAYRRAWQGVLERHSILRTAFVWKDQREPLQAVVTGIGLKFEERDADNLVHFLEEDRQRGFDLSKAPLMRFALLRSNGTYIGVWSHHHLLMDGWSLAVLKSELAELYRAECLAQRPRLAPASPYREYILWLRSQDSRRAESFWRTALAGFVRPTPLGREAGQPGPRNSGHDYLEATLAVEWTVRLQQAAQQHRLTLSTLVQGAWALLLARYSGAREVVFGTTVSGRPHDLAGVESMVGLFINTLPFRVAITGRDPVWEWLRCLQERHSELRQYEYCSSGEIHQWSEMAGSLPLYESALVFENYPSIDGRRVEAANGEFFGARTKHSLTILVSTEPNFMLRLVYDTGRLPRSAAALMAEHLMLYLETLADYRANTTADLGSMVPESEIPAIYPRSGRLGEFVNPCTPFEQRLAELWRDLLGVDCVGATDDFFELGGHSLLATQLVTRIRQAFHVDVPLRTFFDSPTIEGLAALLGKDAKTAEAEIARRPDNLERIPLSFGQERLWFLQQLDPASPVYNVPVEIRFKERVEPTVLEQALNEVVHRHEILRTHFEIRDGRPCQVIAPTLEIPLAVMPPSVQFARTEVRRTFDLSCGPLLRATLLTAEAEAEPMLLLVMHHIVCDGWSVGVLERELRQIYDAFVAGGPSPIPPLPLQYADFGLWQRTKLQDGPHLHYWRKQLEGAPPLLDLPADGSRGPNWSFDGASRGIVLPADLIAELKLLGQRSRATLFMTLLAAFKILLFRWTGQRDIVVGSPIAGRNRENTEALIGFFINTLVLRTRVDADQTFDDLLKQVRDTALEGYAHQDLAFERLLVELQPERSLSRSPLFQVFFNMLNYGGHGPESLEDTEEALAKFDITVYVEELAGGRVQVRLVYPTSLFSDQRIREMLAQYEGLLAQVVKEPGERISCLSLLTSHARAVLPNPREPINRTDDRPVHELFREAVAKAAAAPAIIDSCRVWSYGELDERSNHLANTLLASGLERGDTVAIYAARCAPLVLAVLGVLKAGGAFLILDPAYPASRLIEYLRLARPKAWLHVERAGPIPDELASCVTSFPFLYRGEAGDAGEASESGPHVKVHADDLAYVSFTSGSTGQPKGVLGRHGPLTHFLPWLVREFGLSEHDRFSMLSGLAHDPLQRDMFTALSIGAAICIPEADRMLSPGYLPRWAAEQQVTIAHLTPAMGQVLVQSADAGFQVPSLRHAFFVGDVLTRSDVRGLRELAPRANIVNYYGSTETQRSVGFHVVPHELSRTRQIIPAGRGIPGVQLLVLNREHQLAGVGELGEIYVRSRQLAAGYLGDPELTGLKFVQNPFTDVTGDRLYRSGDLGRYLLDADVEFAGRADMQVQIRGFRVELGEVEGTLRQCREVRDVAVVFEENRLIAYVVRTRPDVGTAEVRRFLERRLPDYMIPAAVVAVSSIPLTPNGKVDRAALARSAPVGADRACTAPRNAVEAALVKIWSETLSVDAMGIDDNFCALGGHSLLAVSMLSSIRSVFQLELPLRIVFEAPTVAAMAEVIRNSGEARTVDVPPIRRISREKHEIPL